MNPVDAEGKPIYVGDILQDLSSREIGVVTQIVKENNLITYPGPIQIDDMCVKLKYGTRIGNKYNNWKHVPRKKQTYYQRYLSWLHSKFEPENFTESITKEEQISVNGILSLLPEDPCDYENGVFYDRLEEILEVLSIHLDELSYNIIEEKQKRKEIQDDINELFDKEI